MLALPRYEGGNRGSKFKEGGQAGHLLQAGHNDMCTKSRLDLYNLLMVLK